MFHTGQNTLTALSEGSKPCRARNSGHGLRSSFSAKVRLLYAKLFPSEPT